MCHIYGCGAEALLQQLDFAAHIDAQLGVEVRQRFVEQERGRFAHDRAAHGDALPLAAGKLPGLAVEIFFEPQDGRRLVDAAVDLGLSIPRFFRP
jgi:hypothetical protein